MQSNDNQFLFVEKYRPRLIKDTILPESTKSMVTGYIDQGRIPNLLFHGGAGTGKTTLARAMCEEVGADYIVINASSENSIDILRTKVTQFASTTSFSDSRKVIILDEADALTSAFQSGFRNAMESFSENCTFILTCNFPQRIIEPIHSRCGVVGFKITNKEKPAIAMQFAKRVFQILENENIDYDKKVVIELIQKYFPDFRRCLNELQKFSSTGKIDTGILISLDKDNFDSLITSLKNKKFTEIRKWTATNSDIDSVQFFKTFYDTIFDKVEPKNIPELVILIGQYQYYASQVADQEINMTAFLTEVLVGNVTWK